MENALHKVGIVLIALAMTICPLALNAAEDAKASPATQAATQPATAPSTDAAKTAESAKDAEVSVKVPVPWISHILGAPDKTLIKQPDTDWFEASINSPLGEGDQVYQDTGAKSEIYIDKKTYLRLDEKTGVVFDKLSYDEVRTVVTRGAVEAANGMTGAFLVDMPGQTAIIPKDAAARIEVDENGGTKVTSLKGTIMIEGPRGQIRVDEGQVMVSEYEGDKIKLDKQSSRTSLDDFSAERQAFFGQASAPPPIEGAADIPEPDLAEMDKGGDWVPDEEYGWVWRPQVKEDWAPYQDGNWTYRPEWGWHWVSYEPWGSYPYHHGRWAHSRHGWVWAPVYVVPRVWHPAMVVWVEGPDWVAWYPYPYYPNYYAYNYPYYYSPYPYYYHNYHYVTVVNYVDFHRGHYHGHVRPFPHDFHVAHVHHSPSSFNNHRIDVTHNRTHRPDGYVAHNRMPSDNALYAHRRSNATSSADARVAHYGSPSRAANRIERTRTDQRTARAGDANSSRRPPETRGAPTPGSRTDVRSASRSYGPNRSAASSADNRVTHRSAPSSRYSTSDNRSSRSDANTSSRASNSRASSSSSRSSSYDDVFSSRPARSSSRSSSSSDTSSSRNSSRSSSNSQSSRYERPSSSRSSSSSSSSSARPSRSSSSSSSSSARSSRSSSSSSDSSTRPSRSSSSRSSSSSSTRPSRSSSSSSSSSSRPSSSSRSSSSSSRSSSSRSSSRPR